MNTHARKRLAAGAVVVALTVAGGAAVAPAATAAAPTGSDLDYFSYAYPGLGEDSVFEAVTFERFEYLLGSEGTFAFLIGGPADPITKATVTHIDAVAAQYGVEKVYAFDPRLDGDAIDIRTTALTDLSALWTRAVDTALNKDTTPAFGGTPTDDPYLFIYDKGHKVDGVEDRIVASLGGAVDTASLATAEGATAYRGQVAGVFGAVEGVDTQTQFEFYRAEMNRKHKDTYKDASLYGGDILTAADEAGFAIRQVTYAELLQVLESDGDHVILFGGTWCHNTRAVIKDVNRAAVAAGVDTVYQFDLRLDGASANDLHIRDTASDLAYLYGDVATQFFPNLRTQYVPAAGAGQRVDYYPGGNTSIALATAKKLQVPYLIEYNKANAAAPIVQDWIRDNGNGTFTEYMTEWWWVAGLPGARPGNVTEANWPARQAQNWAFADEAIAKIDGFFGLATAPAAPAKPTATVTGTSVTATWTAPADGGSPLTQYRVSLDGAAAVSVPAAATTHTFTGVTAGAHTVTVTAVNYIGASAASPGASATVAAPVDPKPQEPAAGPAVSVTGDLRPGGKIVVTGSGLPASTGGVRVELHSTPQVLGTLATGADGAFVLTATIPAGTPSGAHAVVVFVGGAEVVRAAVTVQPAAAAPAAAALPATGGELPLVALAAALVLLTVGGVLFAVRRRRTA